MLDGTEVDEATVRTGGYASMLPIKNPLPPVMGERGFFWRLRRSYDYPPAGHMAPKPELPSPGPASGSFGGRSFKALEFAFAPA